LIRGAAITDFDGSMIFGRPNGRGDAAILGILGGISAHSSCLPAAAATG
jgi:hypothetical protein